MWTLIREGSAARDLARALPFLVQHGTERTALCTDDRNAAALAEHHHLDGVVAALCRAGVPVAAALRAATVTPAQSIILSRPAEVCRNQDYFIIESNTSPPSSRIFVIVASAHKTVRRPDANSNSGYNSLVPLVFDR